LGRPLEEIEDKALAALRAYPWPGNVREMQSILQQAILQSPGSVLLAEFLPAQVLQKPNSSTTPTSQFDWDAFVRERIDSGSETLYAEAVARMECEILVRILQHTDGNQLQAARILGITRGSLRTKSARSASASNERSARTTTRVKRKRPVCCGNGTLGTPTRLRPMIGISSGDASASRDSHPPLASGIRIAFTCVTIRLEMPPHDR
jgi:Bacterial regulatory protein, Fis family